MMLTSKGQLSLDFVITVLFAVTVFFALFPMVQSIQQNGFTAGIKTQERLIANELASQIPLVQALRADENILIRTGSVMDANSLSAGLVCQIRISKIAGTADGNVSIYYPPNHFEAITQSFGMPASFQLVGSPITVPCGCIVLSRQSDDYFGVSRC